LYDFTFNEGKGVIGDLTTSQDPIPYYQKTEQRAQNNVGNEL
jgi:hypothetical protein